MSKSRRYEILLPLKFNDGQAVPRELVVETVLDLEQRFGAVSCETQIIHGIWSSEGVRFGMISSGCSWTWRRSRSTRSSSVVTRSS
jgi:hypothetical protein